MIPFSNRKSPILSHASFWLLICTSTSRTPSPPYGYLVLIFKVISIVSFYPFRELNSNYPKSWWPTKTGNYIVILVLILKPNCFRIVELLKMFLFQNSQTSFDILFSNSIFVFPHSMKTNPLGKISFDQSFSFDPFWVPRKGNQIPIPFK